MSLTAVAALSACSTEPAAETEKAATQGGGHGAVEVPSATELDVAALKQRLDAGEKVFILDVRNPDELKEHGAIPGYTNIPIDDLAARLSEVPKDVPVVTYCMRGGRASRAAAVLRENGFEQPIEYGGITEWKEAGYEVVQPPAE